MHLAIQNTIIKRWAQDNAKKAVWGTNKDLLLEFAYNEDSVVTTKELYEMIYKMYKSLADNLLNRLIVRLFILLKNEQGKEQEIFY